MSESDLIKQVSILASAVREMDGSLRDLSEAIQASRRSRAKEFAKDACHLAVMNARKVRNLGGIVTVPAPAPAPTVPVNDTTSRALRTAAQNLLFDVILAVIVVLLPAFQGDLGAVNWGILLASVVKTLVVTVFAAVQRFIETNRLTQ
jgi:hypothetical protein